MKNQLSNGLTRSKRNSLVLARRKLTLLCGLFGLPVFCIIINTFAVSWSEFPSSLGKSLR